jgi:queuine tRNA-ribosyltransferase
VTLDCEVVVTRTGVHAMRDRTTGELMHPVAGPLGEAERLYAGGSRLRERLQRAWGVAAHGSLVLLDVGLGAGSNAVVAWRLSESLTAGDRRLRIVSFDRSVAALVLALEAQHCRDFGLDGSAGDAARALCATRAHLSARTEWQLRAGELAANLELEPAGSADVVFWDPFSPRANPELWSVAVFAKLRRLCREGATLHTYSGATSVRSALLLAGFAVGVGAQVSAGKFSTCAALRMQDLVAPLDRRWLARLSRSSAPFPADAPADALAVIGRLPQFAAAASARSNRLEVIGAK